MHAQTDFVVKTLGPCTFPSPLRGNGGTGTAGLTPDSARVLLDIEPVDGTRPPLAILVEKAGPRERLFFEPSRMRAGVVTCGGLCPGLNNVLRALVMQLHHQYGVHHILGFRYGFEGLNPAQGVAPILVTPELVTDIHVRGGSFLGVGRGAQDATGMVDTLVAHRLDALFVVGGDGSLRGAHAIAAEVARRGLLIAVVAVPKTIDNDIGIVDKTFGFDTAVEVARGVVSAAHTEAVAARNGVGLVKVMGRDSGFIAAAATLASGEVNFCLIPEVPFDLDGPGGLLASLERRLHARGHALVVVAEGCSLGPVSTDGERDASGNLRYGSSGSDVGPRLRDAIVRHCKGRGIPLTLKYIDPSYLIRGVPANANDAIYCARLARNAVHAALAGKTDVVIGRLHSIFTHVPLGIATGERRHISPTGGLWQAVSATTGQPPLRAPAPESR